MDYKVLCKSPRFQVHHMSLAWAVSTQVWEMMLAMVRNAVGQTATCLELPRQMAIALGAFWKAQYLCHTHIQFQISHLKFHHRLLHLTPHHWKSAEYLVAAMLLLQIGMATAKYASEDFTQKWFILKRSLKDRLLNWLKLLISHMIVKKKSCYDMLIWQMYVCVLVHSADKKREH